jgi:hypothetical protein
MPTMVSATPLMTMFWPMAFSERPNAFAQYHR